MADPTDTPDTTPNPETVLAELLPSPARRMVGLVLLFSLGVLVVYLAISSPGLGLGWRVFLLGIGGVVLLVAEKSRGARLVSLRLTETQLIDSTGRQVARLDQITGVDRGALAFKPSNGFLLHLDSSIGRAWVPGLWWRVGKFSGVGGTTKSGAAKFMAELIAVKIAERDA